MKKSFALAMLMSLNLTFITPGYASDGSAPVVVSSKLAPYSVGITDSNGEFDLTLSATPSPTTEPRLANSATGEVSLSQTEFNISEDNVVNLAFSVNDFAIDTADFQCGETDEFLRFGTSPYMTSRTPYVFFGGQNVSPGGWTSGERNTFVNARDFPYVAGPDSSVTTKISFGMKVSIPRDTLKTTGSCRVTGLVKTLDGKITHLDPGIYLVFNRGAVANSFTGGGVAGKLTLNRESSPYFLKAPVVLGDQSEITVQAGVELIVEHDGPVFEGGGVGGIRILGTANSPIRIKGAKTLWSNPSGSQIEIRHTNFTNFGSIFESGTGSTSSPFGVEIYDSKFFGTRNGGVGGWRVPAGPLVLERNYFENLPAFEFGLWGRGPNNKVVRGNWFEGNSSDKGYWIGGESLTEFSTNVFSNFSSIVVLKVFPQKPRNNAAVPLNWLTLKSSFFNGFGLTQESSFVAKDQVNGQNFSSNGFRIEDLLSAPPFANPALTSSNPKTSNSPAQSDRTEPPQIAQKTVASFIASAIGLTTLQRSQVKAAVEANPNAEKFICTGIRYVSQPMGENVLVRKRAKAACDYAKQLNPALSTWFQNKPTKVRSYAGKVLLTIKN